MLRPEHVEHEDTADARDERDEFDDELDLDDERDLDRELVRLYFREALVFHQPAAGLVREPPRLRLTSYHFL